MYLVQPRNLVFRSDFGPLRLRVSFFRFVRGHCGIGLFAAIRDGLFPHGSARASSPLISISYATRCDVQAD